MSKTLVPIERVQKVILLIRRERVILDADLAALYGVSTKRLNEQVKRNRSRFPADFMFQLTADEKAEVVANCDHLRRLKFSPNLPYVFTEHGTIMAANVLNSERAVHASVAVVRAFVRLREMITSNAELSRRLDDLEGQVRSSVQGRVRRDSTTDVAAAAPPQTNRLSLGEKIALRFLLTI